MKFEVNLDDPDILPLTEWLYIMRTARIWHEYRKDRNASAAARRLGISRYSVYRSLNLSHV